MGMSVFTWQPSVKNNWYRSAPCKMVKKSSDIVVSGQDYCERRNKNKYQQITENSKNIHIYGVYYNS